MKKISIKSNTNAITLIALIITIIILLILAGVTLHLTVGNNGLFSVVKEGTEGYNEQQAREKLVVVLGKLMIDKFNDPTYNEDSYINAYVSNQNMIINDNIVIVDGWTFLISRPKLEIVESLGKSKENTDILISCNSTPSIDFTKATISVRITYNGIIKMVSINGEEIPEIAEEIIDGNTIFSVTKEVSNNGIYNIFVRDDNGNYKIGSITITSITDDLYINNEKEFIDFCDKVKSGATFYGKTVTLMDNINLATICSSSLGNFNKTIGSSTVPFKGTFDGNGKEISNLYVNNGNTGQCLFGYNAGIIKNLTVSGHMLNTSNSGGIVHENSGLIENCTNNCSVTSNTKHNVAGITFSNKGIIRKCVNNGNIIASKTNIIGSFAGIVSVNDNTGVIEYCLNTATVEGYNSASGICGNNSGIIKMCINKGNISGNNCIGGISGHNNSGGEIYNSYNTGNITRFY